MNIITQEARKRQAVVKLANRNGWCDKNCNGLVFTKDAKNRITEISSSDGKNMRYSYSDDNSLIKVTDAFNNTACTATAWSHQLH